MFKTTSMTGVGILTISLTWFVQWLGIVDIDQNAISKGAVGLFDLIGLVLTIAGQLRRKDLSFGLWRK